MKKIVAHLMCMLLLIPFCWGQVQTIRGSIQDQVTQSPIPFVNIILRGTQSGSMSDTLGNFELKNVPVGRYDIQISTVGYDPIIIKEVLVTSSKEVYLNVALKESIKMVKEVIVRPSVSKEQALNPTASVSAKMLSVEEAKRYAGGFDDPARLVTSFPGVASNVSSNAIIVRGNNPQSLQWKLEGVEIPNPNHFADLGTFGGGGLTALSTQLLANSDFFSGAMPAEYNNALSGVFDIFMRSGNEEKAEHTVQLGLLGIDISSEGPFVKESKSSYIFNYRYSTLAAMEPLLPENAGGTRYQDLSFKLNFPTKTSGTFSLWGIGLKDRSGKEAVTDSLQWKYKEDKNEEVVRQYMGAIGVTHSLTIKSKLRLKSSLACTSQGLEFITYGIISQKQTPFQSIKNYNQTFVLSSSLNSKISVRHFNKTGFVLTHLNYSIGLKNSEGNSSELQTIIDEQGGTELLSVYSTSSFEISENSQVNIGVNAQYFTLNSTYTLEPRIGLKIKLTENQKINLGYGLHSRLDRLNYYFSKATQNKSLDFSKSHHFILGYDILLSSDIFLKIESYYQYLFDIPVIADSSFSLINQTNNWFFNEKLENNGLGKNLGLDISLEKYLSKGYYFVLSSSIFSSTYKGGDNIWRNSRYNRGFIFNALIGKEWTFGASNHKIVSINARVSYQGGDRFSAIDTIASFTQKEVIFNEKNAFSKKFAPSFVTHFTASYKINKVKSSKEIALKVINANMYKELSGFFYNIQDEKVEMVREALLIPNLSFRWEF